MIVARQRFVQDGRPAERRPHTRVMDFVGRHYDAIRTQYPLAEHLLQGGERADRVPSPTSDVLRGPHTSSVFSMPNQSSPMRTMTSRCAGEVRGGRLQNVDMWAAVTARVCRVTGWNSRGECAVSTAPALADQLLCRRTQTRRNAIIDNAADGHTRLTACLPVQL